MSDSFQPDIAASGDSFVPDPPKGILDHLKEYYEQAALLHPKESAQALANTALHPLDALKAYGDQNSALADKAKESFKKGDYSEAARHSLDYILQIVPGLGSRLDAAGTKSGQGDYGGAAADTAAIATDYIAGPKAAGPATRAAGTAVDAIPQAVSAVKAGAKAAAPDIAAGGAKIAAGALMDEMGVPSHIGTAMGAYRGVPQVLRGLGKGAKAGAAAFSEVPEVPAPLPQSEAAPVPLPESRQIAAPTAIVTPPPADTSGVIPGWKPTILEGGEQPAAASETAAPTAQNSLTLNDVAKQVFKQDFDSLGKAGKEFVQQALDKYNRAAQPQSAPPPAAATITQPASEVMPTAEAPDNYIKAVQIVRELGKGTTSSLQRRLGLKYQEASDMLDRMQKEGIVGPENGSAPRALIQDADLAPLPRASNGPLQVGGGPLRPPMAAGAPAAPEQTVSSEPPASFLDQESTGLGPAPQIAVNRAAKAQRFINRLGGTQNLPRTQAEWEKLSADMGEKVPSAETQAQITFGLNKRMRGGVEKPGNLPTPKPTEIPNWVKNAKDPAKALKAAELLKQAIQ